MTPHPDNAPVKPAALPLIALILGIVGFCFPPLFLIAIILAIISLANGQDPAYAARKVLAILTLALGVAYVPMVGILAAIAIPNFIKFQARSKQSECKANLKSAWFAQKAFFGEKGHYGETAEEIGFMPEARRRYLYRISEESVVPADFPGSPSEGELEQGIPPALRNAVGLQGDTLTMVCAGNVDKDPFIDVWSISSEDRTIGGQPVPAGTVFNDRDDTRD